MDGGARRPCAQGAMERRDGPARPERADRVAARRPVQRRRGAGQQGRAPAPRCRKAPRRSRPPISGRCRATPRSGRPARSPTCAPMPATMWTASQGTHGNRNTFARFLGLPREKVRLIYLEGSGCYGMNGHEDAAADAAILSRAVGRPVRVQWSREDEHGWDPKGPPQLLDLSGAVDADGHILDWRTEMWIPQTTRGHAQYSAAGPGGRRPRRCARPQPRPDLAERRPALCGGPHPGGRPLAEGCAAASGAAPLARQAGQLLRGRELRRRAGGGGRARPGRVSPARAQGPARRRGHQAHGRDDEMAVAALAAAPTGTRPSRADAASPMSTTSTARPMWRWAWRSRSSAQAAGSGSSASSARTIAGRSSIPTACAPRSRAASCRR